MNRIITLLLGVYQTVLSPILVKSLGHACRFTPTCSEYTREAVKKYGAVKGFCLGIKRFVKCNPLSPVAYDPLV